MLRTKTLQVLGNTAQNTTKLNRVLHTFTLYCCRLVTTQAIYQLMRSLPVGEARDGIRSLKAWLDHSVYRNDLYWAVWYLGQYRRPTYQPVAQACGFDPEELQLLVNLLDYEDIDLIAAAPEPTKCTEDEVLHILKSVRPAILNHVKRRLRFAYTNDAAYEAEDFYADMQCQAIRIIRHYEVQDLTVKQLIPLVGRGLTNHSKNLATYHGKEQRNPLRRLVQRTRVRKVWYCNVNAEKVEHVEVCTEKHQRRGDYYLVKFRQRSDKYVHMRRLHDDQQEATKALREYQNGKRTQRSIVMDLTAEQQDDWCPTTRSLDVPSDPNSVSMHEYFLLEEKEVPPDPVTEKKVDSLNLVTDPQARMVVQCVQGDLGPLFDKWCRNHTGRSSAELPHTSLGRLARQYCGVTKQQFQRIVMDQSVE